MFSRKRSTETLADYAVVAISPLLVMFMVGSLVFFLIQIFYQGEFNARLSFVMAMFVMGTVCVARISMEESASYAAPFAGALGVVVFIALLRFVEFRGPLAGISPIISLFLMFVVWWSANQLTWDCTLLEGKRDTSGQGLLKRLWRTGAVEQSAAPAKELAGQPIKPPLTEPPDSNNWWQDWFSLGTKVHTPGLWVAYFTFAALPLFGIGNLFLGQASVEARRYAFQLLVIYVGSAIGLLITTSFLNIRRYLRQRDLEMPISMTARWLGMGLFIGLAILVVCAILPRRNPEYSVTQLRWAQIEIGSPKQKPNFVAVGPEGTKGNSPATTPAKQPDSSGSKESDSVGEQSGNKGNQQGQSKEQGQGNSSSASSESSSGQSGQQGTPGQNSASGNNNSGQQPGSPMGSAGQKSGDGNQDKGQDSSQSGSSQAKEDKANEPGKEGAKGAQKSEGSNSPSSSTNSDKSAKSPSSNTPGSQGASRSTEPENWNQKNTKQAENSPPNSSPNASSPPPAPQSPAQPSTPSKISLPSMTLGVLLQGLFYLVAIVGAIVLAYYFREELAEAWQKFLAEWHAFWAGLGSKKSDAQAGVAEPTTLSPPRKRFVEFANPFSSLGRSMSPETLIRYLFEALEAWGADRGLPRKSEQTPQEYVEQLATKFPSLAQGLYLLGDLYSQVAYAKGASADNVRLTILGKLWQQLQST
ncbi:MAG: DUF4129 domain-containing protein [Planctomycetaceae bacterium]